MSFIDMIMSWVFPEPIVPRYISQEVLEDCLNAANGQLPDEYLALLLAEPANDVETPEASIDGDEYIITEYYVIPGTETGPASAKVKSMNIPTHSKIVGSFHSHPSGNQQPSQQDTELFRKYPVNIIAGAPFTRQSWTAYGPRANEMDLMVVSTTTTNLSNEWVAELERVR